MIDKSIKPIAMGSLDYERIRQVAVIKSLEVQALCEIEIGRASCRERV